MFAWFAGYRMQFFAERGLIAPITDIYPIEGINEGFTASATGEDGEQYFAPDSNYPWGGLLPQELVRREWVDAAGDSGRVREPVQDMQGRRHHPVAFADKDGWPAMGTFDIINMRTNGYEFHIADGR